ncbi:MULTISPECIES: hypothetical protein [unclassified Clostridium]|uniref:hypothetical protein n=1 Tax=unclassified Clostridium TaxID=2614128 RepID=UPI00029777BA|nr:MULTISPECIES: hypothetical protein [unclassified Clostridium]EKQ53038.1 MAG: hypothetical protein A370_03890 [Clostridium sp. Maddingley MBC34-26]
MRIWSEEEKSVYSYFQWFNKDEAYERIGRNVNLSVISINGSGLFTHNDRSAFINSCSGEIKKILEKYESIKNYKLYLFANVEIKNKNSRIERYKKVWKVLKSKWELEGFNSGSEIEIKSGEKAFFSSIAEFKVENLSTALEIVSSNPKVYSIIASKKEDVLSNKTITSISEVAFNKKNKYVDEIDYFNLSIHLCQQGDMVFRWGESSEEAEIAIILRSDIFRHFSDYARIEIV